MAAVTCLRLLGGSQLDCMKHASAIHVCHSMEVFLFAFSYWCILLQRGVKQANCGAASSRPLQ